MWGHLDQFEFVENLVETAKLFSINDISERVCNAFPRRLKSEKNDRIDP